MGYLLDFITVTLVTIRFCTFFPMIYAITVPYCIIESMCMSNDNFKSTCLCITVFCIWYRKNLFTYRIHIQFICICCISCNLLTITVFIICSYRNITNIQNFSCFISSFFLVGIKPCRSKRCIMFNYKLSVRQSNVIIWCHILWTICNCYTAYADCSVICKCRCTCFKCNLRNTIAFCQTAYIIFCVINIISPYYLLVISFNFKIFFRNNYFLFTCNRVIVWLFNLIADGIFTCIGKYRIICAVSFSVRTVSYICRRRTHNINAYTMRLAVICAAVIRSVIQYRAVFHSKRNYSFTSRIISVCRCYNFYFKNSCIFNI